MTIFLKEKQLHSFLVAALCNHHFNHQLFSEHKPIILLMKAIRINGYLTLVKGFNFIN
jgi:hypothetical protein